MTLLLTCLTIGFSFILLSSMAMAWAVNKDRLEGASFILTHCTLPSAIVLFVLILINLVAL